MKRADGIAHVGAALGMFLSFMAGAMMLEVT